MINRIIAMKTRLRIILIVDAIVVLETIINVCIVQKQRKSKITHKSHMCILSHLLL